MVRIVHVDCDPRESGGPGSDGGNPYIATVRTSATVGRVIARSERAWALLLGLAYLLIGTVAWWSSPSLDPSTGNGRDAGSAMLGLWLTTALLVVFALLPGRGRVIAWFTPAVIGPLALAPLMLHPGDGPALAIALLWPAAVAPLGQVLARASVGRVLSMAAVAAAVVLGVGVAVRWDGLTNELSILRYAAVIAIVAIPGIGRLIFDSRAEAVSATQVTARAEVVGAVVGPSLAGLVLVTSWEVGAAVLVTALLAATIATWIAVRPLSWIAVREAARRDAIVATTETDRQRLAADLHDGPLQDVLLLARRLGDAGDEEGASLARAVAAELRDLSGELRLPMLDDLGIGPSLEWLAGRVRRATALDVRTDVDAVARVPPPVELAAYRIAQEALANAVRHGAPPILVRCRTAAASLSMTVTDAGSGPGGEAGTEASQPLRIGLSSMRQRAELIGADLAWTRASGGGTVVSLEWRGGGA
jgi:signal transduction histidine kinase